MKILPPRRHGLAVAIALVCVAGVARIGSINSVFFNVGNTL